VLLKVLGSGISQIWKKRQNPETLRIFGFFFRIFKIPLENPPAGMKIVFTLLDLAEIYADGSDTPRKFVLRCTIPRKKNVYRGMILCRNLLREV
jgi:hypothetical protein